MGKVIGLTTQTVGDCRTQCLAIANQQMEYTKLWVMWAILKNKKIVRETSVTVWPRPSALPPPPKLVSTYLQQPG